MRHEVYAPCSMCRPFTSSARIMTALPFQPALRLVIAIAIGTTMTACASAPAPRGTPDTPIIPPDTAVIAPQQPGIIAPTAIPLNYSPGTFAYDLVQTTVITVGTDSLGSAQDTLLTTASLTYSIQHLNDTLRIVGIVDSLSVSSVRDSMGPRLLLAPLTIELDPPAIPDSTGIPVVDPAIVNPPTDLPPVPPSCDTMEDAARALARDALPRLPANAHPRQHWVDSASVTVCRGGIPMTATTISTFEIQDIQPRGDSLVVPVVRRSTLDLSGTGTQGSRRITVTGSGTSETVFTFELRGGVLLESQGQSILQLRFETIQQTEQVTQQSTSRVRRRVPGFQGEATWRK